MIVEEIERTRTATGVQLSAVVRSPSALGGQRLFFAVQGAEERWLAPYGDAFLAALAMPAMRLGEELVMEAPVSRRLLRSVRTVMDVYAAWWPPLRPVPVRAAAHRPPGPAGPGAGLFFSTGVDCFYSLLRDVDREATDPAHEPVTHLLFANFDEQSGRDYDRLLERVRRVAQETGRQALVVDTNIRSLTRRVVSWEGYHGAALAGVALALQGLLGRCLIAASCQYGFLPPWGSHPVLDHLWSSEGLEMIHDGADATRTDKVERLAASRLALDNLTVCWRSRPAHNCGVCEKCLRTVIALELVGALGRCATLPRMFDLDQLQRVELPSEDSREEMLAVAADARRRGRDDIAGAAEDAVRRCAPRGPETVVA